MSAIPQAVPVRHDSLAEALLDILRRPVTNLLAAWNWKAACISVLIRASLFFATNLRSGGGSALRASLVEAGFAVLVAGVLASVTQRLRATRPVWATGLVVWLAIPLLLLAVQSAVHHAFGTPHMKAGLIASFCMASVGSGFNWFAQRRGFLVTGEGARDGDFQALPGVIVDFVLAGPRAVRQWVKRRG
jgi:hypothetical protein